MVPGAGGSGFPYMATGGAKLLAVARAHMRPPAKCRRVAGAPMARSLLFLGGWR